MLRTDRLSPVAVKYLVGRSLIRRRSGPEISIMPFRGGASATSAMISAASSEAMGWIRGSPAQAHLVARRRRLGDGTEDLKELRGMDDRIGSAGLLDQRFLQKLRPEIAAGLEALGADHRKL